MVCNEEVFEWFSKELSGTKRVELMCGLMSMCIPLEIRFFKSFIEELAKKDMNTLREAELKANSFQEMDTICKCDLLHIAAEVAINDTNDLKTNVVTNCEIQSNVIQSNCNINSNTVNQSIPSIPQPLHQSSQTPTPVIPIQDMTGVAANGTAILSQNEIITIVPTPPPPQLSHYPSRSRLIISLCFLSPANRSCSVVAFKALRQQLTANQIGTVVNNYLKFGRNVYDLNDFFSGIQLLLTLAVYHPAFSYEERQLIATQRGTVEQTINGFYYQLRQTQNQNYTANTLPFQPYGPPQSVHTPPNSQIHGHIGPHSGQPHTQTPGVNAGGQAAHSQSHSHVNIGQMPGPVPTHQTGQYATHSYLPQISVPTNISYTQNLQNMSNLRVTNITSPVSTPSPTSSPSSSKTVTSVANISPLPITSEFMTHNIHNMTETAQNQSPYILTTGIPPIPHQTLSEDGGGVCAKTIISCYNCGSIGHRGDDCRTQSQEEANR